MGEHVAPKKANEQHLSFASNRRFGIELEFNAFDGRNRPPNGEQPKGIDHAAGLVAKSCPEEGCEIRTYEHTNNNRCWVAKPDSSCGFEIVSPPVKGWPGLKMVLKAATALADDPKITADQRCSVHLHVEVADLSEAQIASVIAWWVKSEAVIMDAMPSSRKRNRYCQLIGMNNNYHHDGKYSDSDIIQRIGDVKYYSLNAQQYARGARKTIEFRVIEGAGCKDPYLIKQWVRFILHFVDMTAALGRPEQYVEPKTDTERMEVTPWTGLCWLDPSHVLSLVGFDSEPKQIPGLRKPTKYTLSKGLQQTKNWFLARLATNMSIHKPGGIRYYAAEELKAILEREKAAGNEIDPKVHLSPSEQRDEHVFGEPYIF